MIDDPQWCIHINRPHIIFCFFPSSQQDCTDVNTFHNVFIFIFAPIYSLGESLVAKSLQNWQKIQLHSLWWAQIPIFVASEYDSIQSEEIKRYILRQIEHVVFICNASLSNEANVSPWVCCIRNDFKVWWCVILSCSVFFLTTYKSRQVYDA